MTKGVSKVGVGLISQPIAIVSRERYEELLAAEALLQALKVCGVDNWEGYAEARNLLEGGAESDDGDGGEL